MSGKSTYIDHAQERGEDDIGKLRQRAEKAEAELADCGEELLQEQEANRNNCGNWNLQVDELKDELAECKKLLEFVDRIPCPNCKELEAERDRLKQDIKGIVNQNATLHIENAKLWEALEQVRDELRNDVTDEGILGILNIIEDTLAGVGGKTDEQV